MGRIISEGSVAQANAGESDPFVCLVEINVCFNALVSAAVDNHAKPTLQ